MINFEDFKKMDIRIARIKDARHHPDADKLLVLDVEIGGDERQIVAGIKNFYELEELKGKKIAVIANLKTATIRGVESHGMLLAASGNNGISLLVPDKDADIGDKVS